MEYQEIINLLNNTPNQPSKLRNKWVEINDEPREKYNEDNQVRFKTSVQRLSLRDYRDAYLLVKGTITISPETTATPNNTNKKLIFNNCAPFTNCISRINNTQVDYAHYIDVVMPMYN